MSVFDFNKRKGKKGVLDYKKPLEEPFSGKEDEGVVETVGDESLVHSSKFNDESVDLSPVEPFEENGLESDVKRLKNSLQVILARLNEVLEEVEDLERRL